MDIHPVKPSEHESGVSYQRLNELYKERKELQTSMKSLQARIRFFEQNASGQAGEAPRKIIKLEEEAIPVGRSELSIDSHSEVSHLQEHKEEIAKINQVQASIQERNKRMFGGLNNYLKKAQSNINSESDRIKCKNLITEKALTKEKEQAEAMEGRRKAEMKDHLQRLREKKEVNAKLILETENLILKKQYIHYSSNLETCFFTNTEPPLAWKPHAQHPHLDPLRSQQSHNLQNQTHSIVSRIMSYHDKFDYSKYIFENERQFYHHFLNNYYSTPTHLLLTNTSPSIFWMPANFTSKLQTAQKQSHLHQSNALKAIEDHQEIYLKRYEKENAPAEEHSEEGEEESEDN